MSLEFSSRSSLEGVNESKDTRNVYLEEYNRRKELERLRDMQRRIDASFKMEFGRYGMEGLDKELDEGIYETYPQSRQDDYFDDDYKEYNPLLGQKVEFNIERFKSTIEEMKKENPRLLKNPIYSYYFSMIEEKFKQPFVNFETIIIYDKIIIQFVTDEKYEIAKKEYDNVSTPQLLNSSLQDRTKEEISASIDDFENQEGIILDSNISKEQNEGMSKQLYNSLLDDFKLRRQSGIISSSEYIELINDLDNKYLDILLNRIAVNENSDEVEFKELGSSEKQDESLEKQEQIQNIAEVIRNASEQKDEYETAKKEYDESSSYYELINQENIKSSEEIDNDLSDFEKEEMKILNSKHFTDEAKKKMLEDLYSEFDQYTEQNPELSGRKL